MLRGKAPQSTTSGAAAAPSHRWTPPPAKPISGRKVFHPARLRSRAPFVLKAIFTWWNSATIGIRFTVARRGVFIGEDATGNRYYEAKDTSDSYDGRKRRWVIYNGYAEASKVPAEWHGWLHHTFDESPADTPLLRRSWELDTQPNLTGTVWAWRPKGAIARGGERAKATGDYEAWRPE
jgi:NADH:ubiquinone oxidoreductase subunit